VQVVALPSQHFSTLVSSLEFGLSCTTDGMVVQNALEELGLEVVDIELGRAVVKNFDKPSREAIDKALEEYGFELLEGIDQGYPLPTI
jgi:rRNA maturation endonuclease Nob1